MDIGPSNCGAFRIIAAACLAKHDDNLQELAPIMRTLSAVQKNGLLHAQLIAADILRTIRNGTLRNGGI